LASQGVCNLLHYMAMQTTTKFENDTKVTLTVTGDAAELTTIKEHVLKHLAKSQGNVPGFRKGKAPLNLIEKQLDPALLQSEFLQHAVNDLFIQAIEKEGLRTVSQPQVDIKKFVPFTALEFAAEVEVVGKVVLPDYKNVKVTKKTVSVTAKDIDEVIESLRTRAAEKKEVTRAAKDGDEVIIDFAGVDAKTQETIPGADGKEYPLVIGRNTFIPGFESELIGLKVGDEKTFDIVFPKDYGQKSLQNKKVTFTIKVHKIQEMVLPKLDDAFAATVGPFKTVAELKADIKKQLTADKERNAEQELENELVQKIAEKTKVALPKVLVDDQIDRMEQEEKQNLMYRGQTWQEHLKAEGLTEEEHREKNRDQAELRVKAGLVLSEIAETEKLSVTPEELEVQIQILKGQYQSDANMLAEIDKPENRRDIANRILTQKTVAKLKELNGV
jgi:trigger factor